MLLFEPSVRMLEKFQFQFRYFHFVNKQFCSVESCIGVNGLTLGRKQNQCICRSFEQLSPLNSTVKKNNNIKSSLLKQNSSPIYQNTRSFVRSFVRLSVTFKSSLQTLLTVCRRRCNSSVYHTDYSQSQ